MRDLIEDKPPVTVPEQSLTRHVGQWEIIGARLCMEGGKPKLSDGCLPITRKASTDLIALIRNLHQEGMKRAKAGRFGETLQEMRDAERLLRVMWAKEIAYAFMTHAYEEAHREIAFQNSDGHALQYCTMEFSLRADWQEITRLLKQVPDFDFEENGRSRKFWNWYTMTESSAMPKPQEDKQEEKDLALGSDNVRYVETQLDSPRLEGVARNLGTIELLKNKMIAQANSRERADMLEKKLHAALGDRIGKANWEIETNARDQTMLLPA